ncbi:MAG: Gfo/Idh/MocA family oxidoreductase [Chthonomonadales bacterium]|nr:Gfo/Idh/MocA family oxidoreductase [Chthonomonadales bacterium]
MAGKIGIGVLSWAHGHVNAYADRIRGFDDARMVACWDDNEERGRANAASFGMRFSPHLEDVLGDPEVECVVVASETSRHADLCVAAAGAGKAILLQKPMALTLIDCDRVIEAVDRAGVWFSLAFQMRHDPQNIHMKRLVDQGAVGRVGIVRRRHCIGVCLSPAFVSGPSRWHVSREANRGMWMDDASHPFDWLNWMCGRPASVIAEIDNVLTDCAPDDAGFAVFRYENGMMAEVHNSSIALAGENTTEIYGDCGVIVQNYGDGPSSALQPASPVGVRLFQADRADLGWQDQGIPVPASHGERIAGVARPFVDALRAGAPMCSAREGRVAVEMILASYESAETGHRVIL